MTTTTHSVQQQHILRIKKSLSEEKCKSLISLFKKDEFKSKIKKGAKNNYCIQNKIHFYEYMQLNPSAAPFSKELIAGLKEYANQNPFLQTRQWGLVNECRLKRFFPGKSYFTEHCEHGSGKVDSLIILAWMFYLNSIPSNNGGGTRFPQQGHTSPAVEGDLLIWPAFWTHSHYGEVAMVNEKYIISGWCRYKEEELMTQ